ncbi:guanine nucleotide-binding protein G(s) subunit alpha-like [Homarus americanus]|uniref:guanine nucleotide-binding protein G(s) subunit alpha-like n=1 Tax=Homarus americanus TaxID=6706 RepID=UPI001C47495A|nr:guanine nucleotide-binding protein G(s) subunit alpha-like [Homarus americanus]
MVFCGVDHGRRQSKELEKKISTWMKEYTKAIKILLLGAGESGKTTIIKQMKILHISGFSPEEKKERHRTAEFYDHTLRLWRDAGIQEVYSQQHRFQLIDCTKYFLDRVEEVRQINYEPTIQDILHSRRRTTDIQKIEFEVKVPKRYGGGSLNFWMFDVGGQRGERKKWIQVFDGIQAVLFLVSASCFDLVIREDEETNRLQESIDIFQSVWHSRFLKNCGFIVFLNKQDILREKVVSGRKNIGDHFPDYVTYKLESRDRDSEEDEEYLRTRCFIRDKFIAISKQVVTREGRKLAPGLMMLEEETSKECYCHFTTATDTNNVKIVFEDVHNMIIMWNLKEIGVSIS